MKPIRKMWISRTTWRFPILRLGNTQSALGNLEGALNFYENYNVLEKELYEAYPQNVGYKEQLGDFL